MKVRNVAIAIFYDEDLNILVQERGEHSRLGEKYGFFGRRIKEGETPRQAMERELFEEIGFVPGKLDYWLEDSYIWEKEGKYKGWLINCHAFLSPITPKLEKSKVLEGKGAVKMSFEEVLGEEGFRRKKSAPKLLPVRPRKIPLSIFRDKTTYQYLLW